MTDEGEADEPHPRDRTDSRSGIDSTRQEGQMLPNDHLIALSQAKATIAERHELADRERMSRAVGTDVHSRSPVTADSSVAHRFAASLGRLPGAIAARTRRSRPTVAKEPHIIVG
jgi:hypothetical protein